jgi:hypothetical protein
LVEDQLESNAEGVAVGPVAKKKQQVNPRPSANQKNKEVR